MKDIIDIKSKEILDVKTEKFLSLKKEEFFGFAKKTVEAYLETGRILCEVNEKLASTDRRTNRWSTWLEEIGVPGRSAREIMQVYRKYGSVGAVTAVTSSTILVALSSPSADPELVSEVESRIQSGEKLTVSAVKDILKKIPEDVRSEAYDQAFKEEFYGKPIEEIKIREAKESEDRAYMEESDYKNDRKEAKALLKAEAISILESQLDFDIRSDRLIADHIRVLYKLLEDNGIAYPKLEKELIEHTMWNDIYPDDVKEAPQLTFK